MKKPIKAKPQFYAVCLQPLQEIARDFGYNLIIHGSMDRDMDLVAIAWVDNPKTHLELLQEFNQFLNGITCASASGKDEDILTDSYCFSMLGGNRSSYVINLHRSTKWNNYFDKQFYLDISFTPFKPLTQ